jgi:hypothetical protein
MPPALRGFATGRAWIAGLSVEAKTWFDPRCEGVSTGIGRVTFDIIGTP